MQPRATRRSPRGESRRAAIIAAAAEEFAAHGYQGSSIAAVAERVGISQSGVLHHFASKDILLDAVVQRRFAEDAEIVDRLGLGKASPLAGYDTLVVRNQADETWVRFLMVLQGEGLTEDTPVHELVRDRYRAVRERMLHRIEAHAGDEFDLPAHLNREDIAILLLAALDGIQLQWLYDSTIDMRRVFHTLISLIDAAVDDPAVDPAVDPANDPAAADQV